MCINSNNAVINNNLYKTPRFYFLFEIRMGTRKDFFEIYGQFGHALSKTFASPDLVGADTYIHVRNRKRWYNEQLDYYSESACIGHRRAAQRVSRRSSVINNALATGELAFVSPGWGRWSSGPDVSARQLLDRFAWNLVLGTCVKICRESPNLVKIGQ